MVETFGCSLFETTARDLYLSPCYPVSITRKDSKKIVVTFIEIVRILEKSREMFTSWKAKRTNTCGLEIYNYFLTHNLCILLQQKCFGGLEKLEEAFVLREMTKREGSKQFLVCKIICDVKGSNRYGHIVKLNCIIAISNKCRKIRKPVK